MTEAEVTGLRRSSRRLSKPPRKEIVVSREKDEDDEEEEPDLGLESSGSDYEEELAKSMKRKRMKKSSKGVVEANTDSSSDEADLEDLERELKELETKTARNSKLSRAAMAERRKKAPAPRPNKMFSNAPLPVPSSSQLSLSESSSDEEESGAKAVPTAPRPPPPRSVLLDSPVKGGGASTDCSLMASKLEALAAASEGTSGSQSQPWTRISPRGSAEVGGRQNKMEEARFDLEVAEALAMGEEAGRVDKRGEEKRDDEPPPPSPPPVTEGVEVTLALPGQDQKAKNKKWRQQMEEACLRREINRGVREAQLWAHRTHFLCLSAHLRYLSLTCSSDLLKAVALSVVPLAHHHESASLTGPRLTQLLSWFKSSFSFSEDRPAGDLFPGLLVSHLIRRFRAHSASSSEDLVLIFLLVARALGYRARLVHNFVPVQLKPDSKNLLTAKKADKTEIKDPTANATQASGGNSYNRKDQGSSSTKSGSKSPCKKRSDSLKSKEASSPKKKSKRAAENGKEVRKSSSSKAKPKKRNVEASPSKAEEESTSKYFKSERPSRSHSSRKRRSASPPILKEKSFGKKSRRSATESNKDVEETKRSSSRRAAAKRASVNLTASALKEAKKRTLVRRGKKMEDSGESDDNDDDDFVPEKKRQPRRRSQDQGDEVSVRAASKVTTSSLKKKADYWVEVLVKGEWQCVDVMGGRSGSSAAERAGETATAPILYVVACDEDGCLKDVTARYTGEKFLTHTRKKRDAEDWIVETLRPFRSTDEEAEAAEDRQMQKKLESLPLPTSIAAFKNHPLYALARHILKFEAIYPPEPPTLGFIKGEAIYPRECVHVLRCRLTWLKQGRVVKVGEKPYKVTTALPKWDAANRKVIKDQPLELFGHWQTEVYEPPPAKDGKVPRNEYGNVELFQPWMLPKGTVHLNAPGLNRVAKKLGIDCAPAMMGWELIKASGRFHPVFDGVVVCEEFSDTLMDAWNQEMEEKAKREHDKKLKKVLDNWKKLVKGLLIASRLKAKYSKAH